VWDSKLILRQVLHNNFAPPQAGHSHFLICQND